MSERARARLKSFLQAPAISPLGFMRGALWISVLFFAAHIAGLREHTRFLSGTAPPGDGGDLDVLFGVLYAILYFAFVLGAPILVGGALVLTLLMKVVKPKPAGIDEPPSK